MSSIRSVTYILTAPPALNYQLSTINLPCETRVLPSFFNCMNRRNLWTGTILDKLEVGANLQKLTTSQRAGCVRT
jgi:hypothetical protein